MTWKQWNNPEDRSWCLEDKAKRLDYMQPPWSKKYPRLAAIMNENPREPLGNTICRNVFVDCTKQVCNFDSNVKSLLDKLEISDNLVINTTGKGKTLDISGFKNIEGTEDKPLDPGLGDLTTQGFSPQWKSWIQSQMPSFESIPLDNIGLYQDKYRQKLPER